jgi:hypothetical protein
MPELWLGERVLGSFVSPPEPGGADMDIIEP